MNLLFTKGVTGSIFESRIILLSGGNKIKTDYAYNLKDIQNLETKYNIKYIGFFSHNSSLIKKDSDFNFIIIKNKELLDISSLLYKLDVQFIDLYDLIQKKIFPNEGSFHHIISNSPQFLSTEGLKQNFFFTKSDFEESMLTSHILKLTSPENQNKLIYMYDLFGLIDDFKNYALHLSQNFIMAEYELAKFLENIYSEFHNLSDSQSHEYQFMGFNANFISSMYMGTIIQLTSCLDVLSKLFCEVINFPDKYDKNIKFKSGKHYFKNLKNYKKFFEDFKEYKNSLIANHDEYNDLIQIRNSISHNTFLSSSPSIFYGFNNDIVNFKKINYAIMYVWDSDNEGNPHRWVNRYKFYGQKRTIDDYILNYLIKFYGELENTIQLLKNYLNKN